MQVPNLFALQTPSLMTLGIDGTSLDLIYTFFRQPGYKALLSIPVSGPNLPQELIESIQVEVMVIPTMRSILLCKAKMQYQGRVLLSFSHI